MKFSTFFGSAAALAGALTAASAAPTLLARNATSNSTSTYTNSTSSHQVHVVDLGYAQYQGFYNETLNYNSYLGIRYAAPPVGSLRFQLPQEPEKNSSAGVINATQFPPICAQTINHNPNQTYAQQSSSIMGVEDCLFLNVYTPANATSSDELPVLVWIHGGGYGQGSAPHDLSVLTRQFGGNAIIVTIQYRLGVFGFVSSAEVMKKGTPNAGIYDQTAALKWVQEHIGDFGGDRDAVSIWGESAGGGSVMLQVMAYDGTLGNSLFRGAISDSPYLPQQFDYDDYVPTVNYYKIAEQVDCLYSSDIFECLVDADFDTLLNASNVVSYQSPPGQWGWLPVTDGNLVAKRPTQQLLEGRVNGEYLFVGNNAHEGNLFVPQNLSSTQDVFDFVHTAFPNVDNATITRLLEYYPEPEDSEELYISQADRANTIYADSTFVCPAYWMAQAYPEGNAYKYTFNVLPGLHSTELAYVLPGQGVSQPIGPLNSANVTVDEAFGGSITSFVRSFDPNTHSLIQDAPTWEPYTVENGWSERVFNSTASGTSIILNEKTPKSLDVRCTFWRSIATIVPE
ncbi:hypothetical protein YB2330_002819 [Saitoella coloradoensis]